MRFRDGVPVEDPFADVRTGVGSDQRCKGPLGPGGKNFLIEEGRNGQGEGKTPGTVLTLPPRLPPRWFLGPGNRHRDGGGRGGDGRGGRVRRVRLQSGRPYALGGVGRCSVEKGVRTKGVTGRPSSPSSPPTPAPEGEGGRRPRAVPPPPIRSLRPFT